MAGTLRNIRFKSMRAQILSIEKVSRVLVKWELEPSRQAIHKLSFVVYRGESPTQLSQITSVPIPGNSLYEFIDYTAQLRKMDKKYYYRVDAVEHSGGVEVQRFPSCVCLTDNAPDLIALYVIEEHLFSDRYISGMPSLIYKKRTEGARCECWDTVLKRVTISSCSICKGTGFISGFYEPIPAWMEYNPHPVSAQIMESGEKRGNATTIRMTDWPSMDLGDIICELRSSRFWRVSSVTNTEKNRSELLQWLACQEINKSDIEQTITIPENIRNTMLAELDARNKEIEF